jgi:hypothetical protein
MKTLTVRAYNSTSSDTSTSAAASDRALWEAFVAQANNGTMFHTQTFLDYHPAERFCWHHVMIFEGAELVAVVPGGLRKDFHDRDVFWSPLGASYGGIVMGDESFERALAIVDAFLDYAKRQNWSGVYVIPPPVVYNRAMTQHSEYALLYRKFGYEYHYISHTVDLSMIPMHLNALDAKKSENANNANSENTALNAASVLTVCDKTARKTIRKILRDGHLSIREASSDEAYSTFYDILLDNKRKHNATPTHTREELLRLRDLMPDKLRLLLVYMRHADGSETPIAGSLLFLCNADVVLCFYNMLLYEFQHEKPMYLVMYETLRWAREQGYRWVDIGVSQVPGSPDPMTPAFSLIEFKERFHARGFIRSTYFRSLL